MGLNWVMRMSVVLVMLRWWHLYVVWNTENAECAFSVVEDFNRREQAVYLSRLAICLFMVVN